MLESRLEMYSALQHYTYLTDIDENVGRIESSNVNGGRWCKLTLDEDTNTGVVELLNDEHDKCYG